MAVAAAAGVDAAVEVAEVVGCGKGTAWAANVLASAVADAATAALEDEEEAAGVAEAATGPSLKGGETSVAALSAAAVGIAASGCCLGAGCGEGQGVLHPPAEPGEAGGAEAGGAWAAGSELVTLLEAERVWGGALQHDCWVGRAAEAEHCAKLEGKPLYADSNGEECWVQVAVGDGVAFLVEQDASSAE